MKLKYIMLPILMGLVWQLALPWKHVTAEHINPKIEINHPKTMDELITYYATRYSVSEKKMRSIIKCESGFNSKAHNPYGEDSWGLVQINLKAHTNITVAQATDPRFAIRFLAYHMSQGHAPQMWVTCSRLAGLS